MNKTSMYEMAVWRAKNAPENHRSLIIESTNAGLASLEGFQKRDIWQSVDDDRLMFDWVEWNTLVHSEAAAKNMMQVPELQSFIGQVENTEVFDHFAYYDQHNANGKEGQIIELVVYTLKEGEDIDAFRHIYSEAMNGVDGYLGRYFLRNQKDTQGWAEIALWENVDKAKSAARGMMENPALGLAFQMVKEVKLVHQYFHRFDR